MTKAIFRLTVLVAIFCACVGAPAQSNPSAASARDLEGTIFTAARRESVDGLVQACGIAFSALVDDRVSRPGAPVKVGGTFHLRRAGNGQILFTLKLGLVDDPGGLQAPSAPANAFIRAPGGRTPPPSTRRDSDPGFALYLRAIDQDVLSAYEAIVGKSQVVVGFNRKRGQKYVTLLLDLKVVGASIVDDAVVRQRSDVPVDEFAACSGELLRRRTPSHGA